MPACESVNTYRCVGAEIPDSTSTRHSSICHAARLDCCIRSYILIVALLLLNLHVRTENGVWKLKSFKWTIRKGWALLLLLLLCANISHSVKSNDLLYLCVYDMHLLIAHLDYLDPRYSCRYETLCRLNICFVHRSNPGNTWLVIMKINGSHPPTPSRSCRSYTVHQGSIRVRITSLNDLGHETGIRSVGLMSHPSFAMILTGSRKTICPYQVRTVVFPKLIAKHSDQESPTKQASG